MQQLENNEQIQLNLSQDQDMKEARDRLEEKNREQNQIYANEQDEGVFSSRTFAIGLICIASFYVFVMIFKAYKNVKDESGKTGMSEEYYEYQTESYDFNPYQSQNTQEEGRNLERGFKYGVSINGSTYGGSKVFNENTEFSEDDGLKKPTFNTDLKKTSTENVYLSRQDNITEQALIDNLQKIDFLKNQNNEFCYQHRFEVDSQYLSNDSQAIDNLIQTVEKNQADDHYTKDTISNQYESLHQKLRRSNSIQILQNKPQH